MHVDRIWNVNPIKNFEGENLLGKGRMRNVKGNYMSETYNTSNFSFFYVSYLFNFYSFLDEGMY